MSSLYRQEPTLMDPPINELVTLPQKLDSTPWRRVQSLILWFLDIYNKTACFTINDKYMNTATEEKSSDNYNLLKYFLYLLTF